MEAHEKRWKQIHRSGTKNTNQSPTLPYQ